MRHSVATRASAVRGDRYKTACRLTARQLVGAARCAAILQIRCRGRHRVVLCRSAIMRPFSLRGSHLQFAGCFRSGGIEAPPRWATSASRRSRREVDRKRIDFHRLIDQRWRCNEKEIRHTRCGGTGVRGPRGHPDVDRVRERKAARFRAEIENRHHHFCPAVPLWPGSGGAGPGRQLPRETEPHSWRAGSGPCAASGNGKDCGSIEAETREIDTVVPD